MNERNINQRQLSNTANIPTTTISGWLNANRLPDYNALIKLADFFGCTTDYLLGREDDFGVVSGNADANTTTLTPEEVQLLKDFRLLSDVAKYKVIGYTHALI